MVDSNMILKHTRHEIWAVEELGRIAKKNSQRWKEKITADAVIRMAVYRLIMENHKKSIKITHETIIDTGFEARKALS